MFSTREKAHPEAPATRAVVVAAINLSPVLQGAIGLFLSLMLGCAATSKSSANVDHNAKPPQISFQLPVFDGRVWQHKDFTDKVVLLDIWATWCRPCRESFPFYAELQQRWRDRGFVVVAVSVDSDVHTVKDFLAKNPLPFVFLHDAAGDLANQLAVDVMPTFVLIDRSGQVVFRHAGFDAAEKAEITAKISKVLE